MNCCFKSDSIYAVMEPSFELFRNRTGLFIDPYGGLKFCSGLGELVPAVTDSAGEVQPKDQIVYNEFWALLKNVELNKVDVIFLGD